jgi:alpha-N-arabinofuranosidase
MASFTKIADGAQPVITVNPAHTISTIEKNTYGGFTEYESNKFIHTGI